MERIEIFNCSYIRKEIKNLNADDMECYRFRMVQTNQIQGLLKVDRRYIDGKTYFYYDVSGMKTLREHIAEVSLSVVDCFMVNMEQLLHVMEEYLLRQQDVCLSPDYIWWDGPNETWKFMYLPDYADKQSTDAENLIEHMMDHINEASESNVERLYEFYNDILLCRETVTIAGMIALWKKHAPQHLSSELSETEKDEMTVVQEQESGCKGKIYMVPFHGENCFKKEGTLT